MEKITHKDDCARVFKNYDLSCPRCQQLASGAKPRLGWNHTKLQQEAMQLRAIRSHNCVVANCGSVCTFGDW